MKFTNKDLDLWIKNRFNVLVEGPAGVGKTSIILDAFKRNNLKYLYFSASTMDPWVDFIGVPKERVDENGVHVLDLVRPAHFAYDEVEAIFLDEYNRAPKKVRNAVMELIQFKSINGKEFKNLKIVWTAVNPTDGLYDTEQLDPAQQDRFHIHVDMDNMPSHTFFDNKYKESGTGAVSWWKEQNEKVQKQISPRRLEYALQVFLAGGDVSHVLPESANKVSFIYKAKGISNRKQLKQLFDNYRDQVNRKSRGHKTILSKYLKNHVSEVLENQDLLLANMDLLPDVASKELCISFSTKLDLSVAFKAIGRLRQSIGNDTSTAMLIKDNYRPLLKVWTLVKLGSMNMPCPSLRDQPLVLGIEPSTEIAPLGIGYHRIKWNPVLQQIADQGQTIVLTESSLMTKTHLQVPIAISKRDLDSFNHKLLDLSRMVSFEVIQ